MLVRYQVVEYTGTGMHTLGMISHTHTGRGWAPPCVSFFMRIPRATLLSTVLLLVLILHEEVSLVVALYLFSTSTSIEVLYWRLEESTILLLVLLVLEYWKTQTMDGRSPCLIQSPVLVPCTSETLDYEYYYSVGYMRILYTVGPIILYQILKHLTPMLV